MFRSADHALRFAFELEHLPIVARVRTMVNARAGAPRGLTKNDLHAQAALIRGRIECFPPLERACLKASFGFGLDRHTGTQALATWMISQQRIGAHRRWAYLRMVEQFFGRSSVGGINEIRGILKCRKMDALEKRKAVWQCLDGLHERAVGLAQREFVKAGLVPIPVGVSA
ncbi:MAG: hypothetical protein AABM33_05985 [Pseudomonadota bacterium]